MQRKNRYAFAVAIGVALLLMATGLIMAFRVFDKYGQMILENEDKQLYELAYSVDRSISSYIGQFQRDLEYVLGQAFLDEAEQAYLERGEIQPLQTALAQSMLTHHPLVRDVVCLQEDEVVCSVQGVQGYQFPSQAGTDGAVQIGPCMDQQGEMYLSFRKQGERALKYGVLVDLTGIYQLVAGDVCAQSRDGVVLMDGGGQMVLHQSENGADTTWFHTDGDTQLDEPALQALMNSRATGEVSTVSYQETLEQQTYEARMAVIPAKGNNGVFVVGVYMDYAAVKRPIHMSAIRLTAYSSMVVVGILLLAGLTIYAAGRSQRVEREMEVLRQRNAQLEEITEKTKTLAHHQRLETIGTLTSSIAHEFNNLLTPIMGYAMMTMESLPPDSEEIYDNVLEIYQTSRRAKSIISSLSDLSRKNTPLTFQFLSPDHIVKRALDMAAPAKPKEVTVECHLDCKYLWVYGNEIQLCQMLLNVLLNAYQAMELEGGTVRVGTCDGGENVCFCISDTGPGMSEEVQSKIFEPFYTTKEAGKGTGLGLAVVQQIVREHRGEIMVHSVPGQGTKFSIFIPMAPTDGEI